MGLRCADAEASHLLENLIGGLRPLEWFSAFVVGFDVVSDRLAKLWDAGVRSALKRVLGQEPKEALHLV